MLLERLQVVRCDEPNAQMVGVATCEYDRKELLSTRLRVLPLVISVEVSSDLGPRLQADADQASLFFLGLARR